MNAESPDRSPATRERGQPARRTDQSLAAVGPPALHQARDLDYVPDNDRDYAWARLGANAQRALRDRVGGEIIDWWASRDNDGLYSAVVLGPTGLCAAEPFLKEDGRRAYRMKVARFAPQSLATLRWNDIERSGSTGTRPRASGDAAPPLHAEWLSEDLRGFLGNLPDKGQQFLQEPFTRQPDLTYAYHYELQSDLAQKTWRFWCYMADDRTVVFESGTKVAARLGRARWQVTCYRATRADSTEAP